MSIKKAVIYRFFGPRGGLLYLGKTSSFFSRLNSHRNTGDWFDLARKVTLEHVGPEIDLYYYELYLIGTEKPKYNRHRPGASLLKKYCYWKNKPWMKRES